MTKKWMIFCILTLLAFVGYTRWVQGQILTNCKVEDGNFKLICDCYPACTTRFCSDGTEQYCDTCREAGVDTECTRTPPRCTIHCSHGPSSGSGSGPGSNEPGPVDGDYGAVGSSSGTYQILSVEFKGDNVVSTDGDTPYTNTDWEDEKKQPVSYKSGEELEVEAKWTLSSADIDATGWKFRGTADGLDQGAVTLIQPADVTVAQVGTEITVEVRATDAPFTADRVAYASDFDITWEVEIGGVWKPAGMSLNPMYITHGEPDATLYHTALHIGCAEANGETDDAPDGQIVTKIWNKFKSLDVQAVEPESGDYYGAALTYYGGDALVLRSQIF